MTRIFKKMKKAFSLTELILVFFIIGLISVISISNFSRISTTKKIFSVKQELRGMQAGLENYYIKHGNYPSVLSEIKPSPSASLNDPFTAPVALYGYAVSPNKKYYVVYSIGSSGDGTASVDDTGVLTENNGSSCIYVSNAKEDDRP